MFRLVVLCAAVALASAGFLGPYGAPFSAPAVTYAAAPVVYAAPYIGGTQYRSQDSLGQYNYGYATANGIAKSEVGGIGGSVAGGYSYTAPDGKRINIQYTAGADGFKATGDAIPKQVEATPEVKEATAKHEAAKTEAAAKAAEAPKPVAVAAPVVYGAYGAYGAYPHVYGAGFHHLKALYHGALGNHVYSYTS